MCAVKEIATLLGVSLSLAHAYVHREVSLSRRRQLAWALLCEFERQDKERAAIRQQLIEMVEREEGLGGDLEASGAGAVGGSRVGRAAA